MSDRTIIATVTRLAHMLVDSERQLAARRQADEKFYAFQEETLAQMRVNLDDMAVMIGLVPPGRPVSASGPQVALSPENGSRFQEATFTAAGDGSNGGGGNGFRGADL
jgi:hypothetical protein